MKLKPSKNIRFKGIFTCYTCFYGYFPDDGTFSCKRDGTTWDAGDAQYIERVCDRYKSRPIGVNYDTRD